MDVTFKVLCNRYARVYIKVSLDDFYSRHKFKQKGESFRITFRVDPFLQELSYYIYTSTFFPLSRNFVDVYDFKHEHVGRRNLDYDRIKYYDKQNNKLKFYMKRILQFVRMDRIVYQDEIVKKYKEEVLKSENLWKKFILLI
ncbi:hypothetical protein GVAV_003103 [Gurleya vavrai]